MENKIRTPYQEVFTHLLASDAGRKLIKKSKRLEQRKERLLPTQLIVKGNARWLELAIDLRCSVPTLGPKPASYLDHLLPFYL